MKKIIILFLFYSIWISYSQNLWQEQVIEYPMDIDYIIEEKNKAGVESIEYEKDGKTLLNGVYKKNYQSGALAATITFVNGKQTGPVIAYYKNGTLRGEMIFENNLLNGKFLSYHRNGKISKEVTYEKGLQKGIRKEYDENGILRKENFQENGKKLYERSYYSNGNLLSSMELLDSEVVKEIIYKENGDFSYENHEKDGYKILDIYPVNPSGKIKKVYFTDGIIDRVEQYHVNEKLEYNMGYKNLKPHGKCIYYDIYGRIRRTEKYSLGVMQKVFDDTIYYEDDKTTKLHGKKTFAFSDGGKAIEEYKDGKKNGESEIYYANGKLMERGSFVNNLEEGKFVEYYENGQLAIESSWRNGLLEGKREEWRKNGIKVSEQNYKNGLLDGTSVFYNEKGDKTLESSYKANKVNGAQKSYRDNIMVLYREYKDGKLHGVTKYYHKDGRLQSEEKYENGNFVNDK